jgi:hypothetical protein
MAKETTEKKLYDLLTTRDYDNFQAIDSRTGKTPVDPENGAQDVSKADMFTFDWSSSRGKNYGTAVILLTPEHELELYFGDNLGKTIEDPADKDEWFAFMEQLRHFATRTNFNGFRPLNINQLRHSLQGQAAIKEGLFESWQGRKNMSWSAGPTEARLMIKHKRNLDETDARHHYIESLFIETAESERYKLKFNSLTAGRAMLEHVRQGGRPYDARGQHISDIVEELNVLSRFERSVARDTILEGDTAQLVQEAAAYRSTLKSSLKRLGTGRGYSEYFESWNPVDLTEQDVVIESLKHMFVKQTLDARIEQALPLLARIQQQGNAMKEANIFEAWADRLVEGTWSMPDTPEAQKKLLEFMSREQPVGADATDATEQLYDLLGDDQLFDQLAELAESDPDADCRQIVLDRMQELSDDPDVREVLEQLNIDADAEMTPPESLPADLSDQEKVDEGFMDFIGLGKSDPDSPFSNNRSVNAGSQQAYDDIIPYIVRSGGAGQQRTNGLMQTAERLLQHIYHAQGVKLTKQNYAQLVTNRIKADVAKAMGQTGVAEDAVNSLRRAAGLTENVLTDDTGSTFQHILDTFKRDVRDFKETGEVSKHLHNALDDYYHDDMPYGTHTADDGDPYEWIADRFGSDLGLPGYGMKSPGVGPEDDPHLERESAGDYAPERATHSVDGGMDNSILYDDSACNMSEAGEHCPTHGVQECWGAMANEDDEKNDSVMPALAGAVAGGAAGYALGSGALDSVGSSVPSAPISPPVMVEKDMDRMKKLAGVKTTDEGVLGTLGGAALGSTLGAWGAGAGAVLGDKLTDEDIMAPIVGGLGGAALGGIAGHYYSEKNKGAKETDEGWKGQLAGGTVGSLAGGALGATIGPVGAALGSALGGTAGQMVGDKVGNAMPDDKEPTKEGVRGAIAGGALGGVATKSLKGVTAGATLGSAIQDRLSKKDDTSPLAGQYGHSGKMQAVDKDTSFLDRLKELSGIKQS